MNTYGPTRPTVPPAPGAETGQAVLDIITLYPEMHNQNMWEYGGEDSDCGTTRCVAGWVQWLHLGYVSSYLIMSTVPELLGLSFEDADKLFYADAETAVRALKYVANGEKIPWTGTKTDGTLGGIL